MDKKFTNKNLPNLEDDFSTSISKLAELAAQGIQDKKKEDNKSISFDEFNEFVAPKRIQKEEKDSTGIIKIKINPYVASGVLIVIMSLGVIGIPKISHYLEKQQEARGMEERKKLALLTMQKKSEQKLTNYTVFDAIKDTSSSGELKMMSISDLAKSVSENNSRLALVQVSDEDTSVKKFEEGELLDLESYYAVHGTSDIVIPDFDYVQNSGDMNLEPLSFEIIFADIRAQL